MSTHNIKPIKYKSEGRTVEILESGDVFIEIGRRNLQVSSDGIDVVYNGRPISVHYMSRGATRLYEYARSVIDVARKNTVKKEVKGNGAVCKLYSNFPNPNFEIKFDSGIVISHIVGDKEIKIRTIIGNEIVLNPFDDQEDLDCELRDLIDAFFQGLEECLIDEEIFN